MAIDIFYIFEEEGAMSILQECKIDNRGDLNLYDDDRVVCWCACCDRVNLEGFFTAEDLEFIAKHMKEHMVID